MPPLPGQEEGIKRMTKIVNSLLARQDCSPFREPVDWRGLELYDYPQIITKMMDLGTIKRKLERGHYATAHQVAEDVRLVWSNCMTYNADGSDFWLLAKSFSRRFEDRYRKVKAEFDVGEHWDSDDAEASPSTRPSKNSKSSSSSTAAKDSSAGSSTAQNQKASSSSLSPSGGTGGGSGGGGGSSASANAGGAMASSSSSNQGNTSSFAPSLDARARFGANLFYLSGSELGHVITTLELECPNVLEPWDKQKIEIKVDEIPPKLFSSLQAYVTDKVGARNIPPGSPGDAHDTAMPTASGGHPSHTSSTSNAGGKSRKRRKTV